MKNKYFIIACAAAVLASGCAKETLSPASLQKTTLTFSIEDATRTTIGELDGNKRPVYWENGDQIAVNGIVSAPLTDVAEQSKEATFTFDGSVTAPYNVIYPASLYVDANTVKLPCNAGDVPMGGQGTKIGAITSIVKVSIVKGEEAAKLFKVEIRANDARQLSGNFTFDYAAKTLTPTDASGDNAKVYVGAAKTLGEEAAEYFLPVPAGNYGFTVKVIDNQGHYMEKSTTAAHNLVAGQVTALPAIAFNPTGTEIGVEINTAADLVKYAQDFNAGKYDSRHVATLTNDIVFDDETSAAFLATGGIGTQGDEELGTSDNYYEGIFNGNGKSIKNWKNYHISTEVPTDSSAVSLFAYTGKGASIINFTLDESCDLSGFHGYCAPVAGRHKGLLKGIKVNAPYNYNFLAGTNYIAGIVSRIYEGTVEDCEVNADVNVASTLSSTKVYKFGGIASTVEAGGVIRNCRMNANLQWGMRTAGDGPSLSNGKLYLGLIAGHVIDGTVEGCTAIPQSGTSSTDVRGKAGKAHIGGIVGCNDENGTVSGCEFTGTLYVRSKGPSGEGYDTDDFFCHVGGIVGLNAGTITNCNYSGGKLTNNSAQYKQTVGGICGENSGEITNCENYGSIIGPSQYTVTVHMYEGGLVGYTTTPLSNLTNNGDVTLSTSDATYGSAKGVARYIGGCVGYVNTDITLDNLTNKGGVTTKQTTKVNGAGYTIGGIVGAVESAAVISNCVNEGVLYNNVFNNTYSPMLNSNVLGGIVGVISAPEGVKATVANCTSAGEYAVRRGVSGGIVGWGVGAAISGCTVTGNAGKTAEGGTNENISVTLGGVVGKAEDTGITDCTVTATLRTKGATARATYGGIVGSLDPTSFVDKCMFIGKMVGNGISSSGEDIYGSIAGSSVEGAYIHNCGVKGSVDLAGDGNTIEFSVYDFCGDLNYEDEEGTNYIIED